MKKLFSSLHTYSLTIIVITCFWNVIAASDTTTNTRTKKPKDSLSYAAIMFINEKSEILLLKRQGTSFGNGLYSLPGGKIESGETIVEAAVREAQEEIGIIVDDLKLVHILDRQGKETEFYIFGFKAVSWSGTPSNCEPHKCSDLAWFHITELPKNIIPAHKQIIELTQQGVLYSQHGWELVNK